MLGQVRSGFEAAERAHGQFLASGLIPLPPPADGKVGDTERALRSLDHWEGVITRTCIDFEEESGFQLRF
jgi:hypothetical protein